MLALEIEARRVPQRAGPRSAAGPASGGAVLICLSPLLPPLLGMNSPPYRYLCFQPAGRQELAWWREPRENRTRYEPESPVRGGRRSHRSLLPPLTGLVQWIVGLESRGLRRRANSCRPTGWEKRCV